MKLMDYYTITASNFVQPITLIASQLVREQRDGVEGKTNEVDLDWIYSGIVLAVVFFEASLRWTQQHRAAPQGELTAPTYYEQLRAIHQSLPDMGDVFVVRNVIAHGHVWLVSGAGKQDWLSKFLLGRQDKQWIKYVDSSGKRTITGLNLVPSVMTRGDFKQVLERVIQALQAMVVVDLMLPNLLNHHPVWPGGERVPFAELPARIR